MSTSPDGSIDLVQPTVELHPIGSVRRDSRDGHTGRVEAVGLSRGQLSVWLTGRAAVPLAQVAR